MGGEGKTGWGVGVKIATKVLLLLVFTSPASACPLFPVVFYLSRVSLSPMPLPLQIAIINLLLLRLPWVMADPMELESSLVIDIEGEPLCVCRVCCDNLIQKKKKMGDGGGGRRLGQ